MEKADKQMMNVEQMLMDITSAVLDQELFKALKMGKECLDALQRECSVEDVQDLMDDVADGIRMQEEISNTLGKNLTGEEMDLLEGEVEELMGLMLTEDDTKRIAQATGAKSPVKDQKDQKTEDEVMDELAALPVPSHGVVEEEEPAKAKVEKKKKDEIVIF